MKCHANTEQAFEEIDAAIFSGDILFTDFQRVKDTVERWSRAVKNHEKHNLEEIMREELKNLLSQCTEKQVAFFNRLYKSVDLIPKEQMENAICQCERTIKNNG